MYIYGNGPPYSPNIKFLLICSLQGCQTDSWDSWGSAFFKRECFRTTSSFFSLSFLSVCWLILMVKTLFTPNDLVSQFFFESSAGGAKSHNVLLFYFVSLHLFRALPFFSFLPSWFFLKKKLIFWLSASWLWFWFITVWFNRHASIRCVSTLTGEAPLWAPCLLSMNQISPAKLPIFSANHDLTPAAYGWFDVPRANRKFSGYLKSSWTKCIKCRAKIWKLRKQWRTLKIRSIVIILSAGRVHRTGLPVDRVGDQEG